MENNNLDNFISIIVKTNRFHHNNATIEMDINYNNIVAMGPELSEDDLVIGTFILLSNGMEYCSPETRTSIKRKIKDATCKNISAESKFLGN